MATHHPTHTTGPTLVLSGRIEAVPIPEVLQLLGAGRRSGLLIVEPDDLPERAEIELLSGNVVRAELASAPDPIGSLLLHRQSVEPLALGEALRRQSATAPWRPLGSLLLEMQAVEPGELALALAEQVEQTIATILGWDRGVFRFRMLDSGPTPAADDVRVYLDPQRVLLRAARRADEGARSH